MDDFEEEFSKLLLRFTLLDINDNNIISNKSKKLSIEEIITVIKKIIWLTFKVNLQNLEDAALKTPSNEIVTTTPNAPDVLRLDYNQNNTLQPRNKFLEGVTQENADDNYLKSCNLSSLSNYSDEVTDVSDNNSLIVNADTIKQKKILRNDVALANKPNQGQNSSLPCRGSTMNSKFNRNLPKYTNLTMHMVDEANTNAMQLVKLLDKIKKMLMSENKPTKPRISMVLRLPIIANQFKQRQQQQQQQHSSQKKQTEASIQHSKVLRRYVHQVGSNSPVTPTSSKSNIGQSRQMQTPKKTNIPMLIDKRGCDQYKRTLAETTALHGTKNSVRKPRFAHVQSTIPKVKQLAAVLK